MESRNIEDFFAPKPKPSEALASASKEVICLTPIVRHEVNKHLKIAEEKIGGSLRGKYRKYTDQERAEIGKYAAMHGVAKTVRKFQVSQQSASDFKRKLNELKRASPSESVTEIAGKKRGRPSLLPEELMDKTIEIIKALRLKAAPVSYSIIAAVAKGVVIAHDRNMLAENGGHLMFSDDWARKILYKIAKSGKKMVSRMATTASLPVDPAVLSETKLDFQRKIKRAQEEYDIPDDLIINFDQTPVAYISAGNRTMDFQGNYSFL